jgi:hypothetical protein
MNTIKKHVKIAALALKEEISKSAMQISTIWDARIYCNNISNNVLASIINVDNYSRKFTISWKGKQKIDLDFVANVFEYFEPFSKEKLNHIPQLWIENKEINLGSISASQVQSNVVNLLNKGKETLEIRKIQGNCECLQIDLPKNSLEPGESVELNIVFDPKGRFGIDQRNIYLFSNDPVNPVQLLVIKSKVE